MYKLMLLLLHEKAGETEQKNREDGRDWRDDKHGSYRGDGIVGERSKTGEL